MQIFGLHVLTLLGTDLRVAVLESLGANAKDNNTDIYDGLSILLEALRRCGTSGQTHQAIVCDIEHSLSKAAIVSLMSNSNLLCRPLTIQLANLCVKLTLFPSLTRGYFNL